ncbi:MAG TPA: ParB N-terminal domain-containing protein [Urbifossiella sp.]|nr:ParB N-terminal domain-containing protein [Urbifossiella sp.]
MWRCGRSAGSSRTRTPPRRNDAGVDAVAASIRAFGFRQPCVVDEQDGIVVGYTRYKAALKLGLAEVTVHMARGLPPIRPVPTGSPTTRPPRCRPGTTTASPPNWRPCNRPRST